jgi:Mor family transcriptional regulator
MSHRRTTAFRNCEIFDAFKTGKSIETLAEQYDLTIPRVRAVVREENNRRSFSPEPFYRALRSK